MAKIEVKDQFNYADYATSDLSALSSVAVSITHTISPMFKIHRKSFIGILENLSIGDVIFIGIFPKTYKIISIGDVVKGTRGRLYRIRRTDRANITEFDFNNTPVNSKIKVLTRKSYEQLRNINTF